MSTAFFEPQIKQHTATVLLRQTVLPLVRWSIDPRYTSTLVIVTVRNTSELDLPVSLKFQASNGSPADDHQCALAIPASGANPNAIKFTETFGGFNSTFTDLSGGSVTTLVAGGEKTITFTTTKAYLQVVATAANNARAHLYIKSLNTLSPTESDDVRINTALP